MSTSFAFHFRPSTKRRSDAPLPGNTFHPKVPPMPEQSTHNKLSTQTETTSQTATTSYPGSIFLRIIHNRKALNITTPYRVYPHEWDPNSHTLIMPDDDSVRVKYLSDSQDSMDRDLLRLSGIVENLEKQGYYTLEQIMSAFVVTAKSNMLTTLVEMLAGELELSGQERTARAYRTAANGLIRFNKGRDLRLVHINENLIRAYEKELKSQGKSMNTISFYMRNLRAIYNKAIAKGCIYMRHQSPFAQVYTGIFVTRKRALTKSEIKQLNDLDLMLSGAKQKQNSLNAKAPRDTSAPSVLTPDLQNSLAMFMFCFHARGMSFVDLAYLTKNNIKKGTIRYFRKKTGQLLEVKITPVMQRIINHFENQTRHSNFIFPVITNPDRSQRLQYESGLRMQNERLKKLAKLAGIDKRVSTHVARHSWATIAKHEKLPLWVISEGLGHSNEKTTYTYLASFDRSVIDQANDTISRAVRRAV